MRSKTGVFKFVIVSLVLAILALVIALILPYFKDSSNVLSNTMVVDMTQKNANSEFGFLYHTPISEEHIAEENGIKFIDNEILIVVKDGTHREQVVELSENYNAEIVGEIEITGDYQLRFNNITDNNELLTIVEKLNDEDVVETAILNYVSEISEAKQTEERNGFYYGKKWQGDLQNFNDVKGKSWGIEAIDALGAWDKLCYTSRKIEPVKVGIIDGGFDVNHEDLNYAEVFYDNGANGLNSLGKDHGTHVSGTIAAKNNDTTGICGVYPYGDGRLYGVSHGGNVKNGGVNAYSENGNYWSSVMSMKIAYSELIVRNVKVINQSQGFNYYTYDYFKKKNFLGVESIDYYALKTWWEDTTNFSNDIETAKIFADFLNRMLQKGYDFVIVSAAGNDSDNSIGHLDCRYSSWLNMIRAEDYPDVYDRIIVVGAVNQKMQISNFSNGGDRVDIYAPGSDIYSTIPNNKYMKKSGTSMAAPHVAGVAAMVWSANNSLTGAQVKEAICHRGNMRCTSCKMLDAFTAVEYALGEDDNGTNTNASNGGILCYVVEYADEDKKITNANVIVTNTQTGDVFSTNTDELGHFEIMVPEGKYSLKVTASGYEDYIWPDGNNFQNPIIVKNEGINYLDDWIKMKKIARENFQLSVFALEADAWTPIANKEITLTIDNTEITCSNPKQIISSIDGSVIFNINMGKKNRQIDSKVTLHIDGYKDFTLESYRFGNDPSDMLLFDAIFEKESENDAMIKKILTDETWQEFPNQYLNIGYANSEVYCWFQDMNMDGIPEFIIGPMVSGAHAAHDFEIYTYQNGSLKQLFGDIVTIWPNGRNMTGENSFNYQLYKKNDGSYIWFSEEVDGVATESYYILNAIGVNTQCNATQMGDIFSITESAKGKNYSSYTDQLTREEFLDKYENEFKNLQYCDITRQSFHFKDYLNANNSTREAMLKQSYEAWTFTPSNTMIYPFDNKIAEIRSESTVAAPTLSEIDLRKKVESIGTLYDWEYHDFDGNGTNEAYAIVANGSSDYYYNFYNFSIYFVSSTGELTLMDDNGSSCFNDGSYSTLGNNGFFSWDSSAGGSGFTTYLYGVKDGNPYELTVSGNLQGFYKDENHGYFYTTQNDFSNGFHEYPSFKLEYDNATHQFTIAEKIIE